jgi:hypothetical protein
VRLEGDLNYSVNPPSDIFHRFMAKKRRDPTICVKGFEPVNAPSGEEWITGPRRLSEDRSIPGPRPCIP